MKPERARELAKQIGEYANQCCYRTDGYQEDVEKLAQKLILHACAEQREEDARLMGIMSGQISELTEQFDSSRAEGAFNALVNGAAAIRGQT
jgi:hypothetical protein